MIFEVFIFFEIFAGEAGKIACTGTSKGNMGALVTWVAAVNYF